MHEVTNPFSAWESFYVIVGSAGGALTGLQFVVIALLTELRKKRTLDQLDAFATPTIVHFWRCFSSAPCSAHHGSRSRVRPSRLESSAWRASCTPRSSCGA